MGAQHTADTPGVAERPAVIAALVGVVRALAAAWRDREDGALFGMVSIPIAMTATGLLGQWWSWPLLLMESVVATRTWRWSWVVALELAFVGTQWAFVGASALASWPSLILPIGTLWAAFPAVLAVAVAHHRQQSLFSGLWPKPPE